MGSDCVRVTGGAKIKEIVGPESGIDWANPECQRARVSTKKAAKTKPCRVRTKTRGTIWAEENRARCNQLTDAERERLMQRALQVVYATEAPARRS